MNCRKGDWVMRDTAGQDHRVECDRRCRNHLYMARDLCVLPAVRHLARLGVSAIRIEAPFDSPEAVRALTAAYREAIDHLNDPSWQADPAALSAQIGRPMGDGLHAFDTVPETDSPACAHRCISA
jgi:putative protease